MTLTPTKPPEIINTKGLTDDQLISLALKITTLEDDLRKSIDHVTVSQLPSLRCWRAMLYTNMSKGMTLTRWCLEYHYPALAWELRELMVFRAIANPAQPTTEIMAVYAYSSDEAKTEILKVLSATRTLEPYLKLWEGAGYPMIRSSIGEEET